MPGDWYQWQGEDLILRVYVQPKASKNELAGLHNHRLKVRITAPPTDGKANEHLKRFLAKLFGTPYSGVQLLRGSNSRNKKLLIKNPGKILPGMVEQE